VFQDSEHDCVVEFLSPERKALNNISSYDTYSWRITTDLVIDSYPKADP